MSFARPTGLKSREPQLKQSVVGGTEAHVPELHAPHERCRKEAKRGRCRMSK